MWIDRKREKERKRERERGGEREREHCASLSRAQLIVTDRQAQNITRTRAHTHTNI